MMVLLSQLKRLGELWKLVFRKIKGAVMLLSTEDEIIAKYGYYNYWQTLYNKLEEQQLYSLNVKRGAVYIK